MESGKGDRGREDSGPKGNHAEGDCARDEKEERERVKRGLRGIRRIGIVCCEIDRHAFCRRLQKWHITTRKITPRAQTASDSEVVEDIGPPDGVTLGDTAWTVVMTY